MLAKCMQLIHNAAMPVQITIRNVPQATRDELAARAALQGKSMQEYLRGELLRMTSRPSIEHWLAEVRRRKKAAGTTLTAESILEYKNTDGR